MRCNTKMAAGCSMPTFTNKITPAFHGKQKWKNFGPKNWFSIDYHVVSTHTKKWDQENRSQSRPQIHKTNSTRVSSRAQSSNDRHVVPTCRGWETACNGSVVEEATLTWPSLTDSSWSNISTEIKSVKIKGKKIWHTKPPLIPQWRGKKECRPNNVKKKLIQCIKQYWLTTTIDETNKNFT